MDMRRDAESVIHAALQKMMPDGAVTRAPAGKSFCRGRIYLVAAGVADYVILPITFLDGKPRISWRDEWRLKDYR